LNDDVHGRTLDASDEYGTASLLAELANEISQEFIPVTGRKNGHLDTSSLKVCGDYDVEHLYPDDADRLPLPRQTFGCEQDALRAAKTLEKKL
jgi:hypothetical protein